jgi:hypothetical protein
MVRVSDLARKNGWAGFRGIGEKVEGGWLYRCDGMPSMFGCPQDVVVTRRFSRVGEKSTGWLVTYGRTSPDEPSDDNHGNDLDVVLTFCPSCAAIVKAQEAYS